MMYASAPCEVNPAQFNAGAMKRITSVNVRISPEMKDDLQVLADRYRRKLSDYVRLVLEHHLEQQKRREPGTFEPPRVAGVEGDDES